MGKDMRLRTSLFLLFVLFAPTLSYGTQQPSAQGSFDDKTVFQSVLPSLSKKTRVPLRLPTYLATETETNRLYAIVESATPARYGVQLAFDPECNGGNACRYGFVAGQVVASSARRLKGKAVKLAKGITGYFIDAKCGANCTDSTLSWKQDGYRYTVGLKAAKIETLTKIANSAIKNEQH